MHKKHFWLSVVSVWFVMFVTDWVLHGMWLGPLYQSTSQFWRPPSEATQFMWATWLGNAIFAWAFVWIYQKGLSQDNVWVQAFRYALAFLLVAKIPALLMQWNFAAYPAELIWKWGLVYFIQAFACAFAMTWVYKPAWKMQWHKG
jgi:hypothetical protein